MAQGTIKSKKLSTATAKSSGGRPSTLGPKKGARTIAPRKQVLVKSQKMLKVCFIFYPFLYLFFGCVVRLGAEDRRGNSGSGETERAWIRKRIEC